MRNNRPEKGPIFVQMLISIFVLVFAVFLDGSCRQRRGIYGDLWRFLYCHCRRADGYALASRHGQGSQGFFRFPQ